VVKEQSEPVVHASLEMGGERQTVSPSVKEIVKKIMTLESSDGKNNYSKCQEQGLYNRYGYGIPGDGTYLCFEKDKDTEAVEKWFEKRLKENTLEECLCYYNLGLKVTACPYSYKFKQI
jgi:hypothetical protein